MLVNPDIQPSASVNCWIVAILTFHFDLVHVKGTYHGPDGLSHHPAQPGNVPDEGEDDFEDWIDQMHGFVHIIQDLPAGEYFSVSSLTSSFIAAITRAQDLSEEEDLCYTAVPHSAKVIAEDIQLCKVCKWHIDWVRPDGLSDKEYMTFLQYCTEFFPDRDRLWQKDNHGAHKLVIAPTCHLEILSQIHDDISHKRFYATRAILMQRFWWPHVQADIVWFVRTCHLCQIQQTMKVLIPPVVSPPAPLFAKVYVNTMHMPGSGGFGFCVQGRCSLVRWLEFCMLRT